MKLSNFENFLFELNSESIKTIDKSIDLGSYTPFDLSVSNKEFNKVNIESSANFQAYVNEYLLKNNAKVAYGGYNEERNIYQRSSHFNDQEIEERNIHLGIDFWIDAKTNIYTPLDGEIYGFADNVGLGNYGPTIILKHDIKDIVFYTLYGHLSRESLVGLTIGKPFFKGDKIATLGTAEVNGDYPPHLHFQVIKDMGVWKNDYPGVCSKLEREFYLNNCPNPNLLLKIGG